MLDTINNLLHECCMCKQIKRTDGSFVDIINLTAQERITYKQKYVDHRISHTYCPPCYLKAKAQMTRSINIRKQKKEWKFLA